MALPPSMQGLLPAGWLAFTGRESNSLDRYKRFQVIHPPFLDLAWRKGSFMLNLPLWFRSFNHLVGARKQRWRQLEAERLGAFEVDRQIDPGRELDRQIARFGALENPVDVAGRMPIALSLVDAVRCEQARLDIFSVSGSGREPRGEREPRNLHTLRKEQTVHRHDDGLHPLLAESTESGSELAAGSGLFCEHRHAAGARGGAIGSVGATLLNAMAALGALATRMSGLSAINSRARGS